MFLEVYPQVLGVSTVKVCRTCGEPKPIAEFSPARKGLFGVKGTCKRCCATIQGEYYRANKSQCLETVRKWQSENPEKVTQYKLKSAANYRDERNSLSRKRYEESTDFRLCVKQRNDKWRVANPDKVRAAERRRRQADPAKSLSYAHNRRARKLGNGGKYTSEDVQRQIAGQTDKCGNVHCWICGNPMPPDDMTIDHFIPLFLGGTNDPGNIRIAHRKCNSRKGRKHPHEIGRLI